MCRLYWQYHLRFQAVPAHVLLYASHRRLSLHTYYVHKEYLAHSVFLNDKICFHSGLKFGASNHSLIVRVHHHALQVMQQTGHVQALAGFTKGTGAGLIH